jgi:hypothetical protein
MTDWALVLLREDISAPNNLIEPMRSPIGTVCVRISKAPRWRHYQQ